MMLFISWVAAKVPVRATLCLPDYRLSRVLLSQWACRTWPGVAQLEAAAFFLPFPWYDGGKCLSWYGEHSTALPFQKGHASLEGQRPCWRMLLSPHLCQHSGWVQFLGLAHLRDFALVCISLVIDRLSVSHLVLPAYVSLFADCLVLPSTHFYIVSQPVSWSILYVLYCSYLNLGCCFSLWIPSLFILSVLSICKQKVLLFYINLFLFWKKM